MILYIFIKNRHCNCGTVVITETTTMSQYRIIFGSISGIIPEIKDPIATPVLGPHNLLQ
jgi:hypothetical protein